MGQKVKLDFTGVESFQRVAEGIHPVKVASAELTTAQSGNDMITVAFEVTQGADKGGRVYENYPIVDKALWKLKGFLQAIGMKADGKLQLDVDKLVGKVLQINVIHEEYDGKVRARVESTIKYEANTDDDFDEDEDVEEEVEATEDEEVEEEKPAKKSGKKAAKEPEPEEDDDDNWDDDEEEAEEEPEQEKKPVKKAKKEKPAKEKKAPAKKSKKEEPEEDDDDWDEDEDWDEE